MEGAALAVTAFDDNTLREEAAKRLSEAEEHGREAPTSSLAFIDVVRALLDHARGNDDAAIRSISRVSASDPDEQPRAHGAF